MKLKFSGHETFSCRTFWLKKGYDFVLNNYGFNNLEAPSQLGVGKNMVSSIQHWMKSMNLLDSENHPTELANDIFANDGYDPFLEDIGTIWLLHSELVKTGFATLYNIFFNEFRLSKPSFTKTQLLNFVTNYVKKLEKTEANQGTVIKDINIFCKLYNQPDYKNTKKNFEDEVSSLFLELELMKSSKLRDTNNNLVELYTIDSNERHTLPSDILLYYILDNYKNKTIPFKLLEVENNSPGKVFCLSRNGLYNKIKEQEKKRDGLFISETAGNVVLNIPEGLNADDILNEYYDN